MPNAEPTAEELLAQLGRERIVRENLAARFGTLMAENIELLVRIHELESAQAQTAAVQDGHAAAVVN